MKRTGLAALVAGTLLLSGCGGEELVIGLLANPGFATTTSGWAVEDPPSATLGPSNGSGIFQCVSSVTAGASYTFGGKVLFPAGQARTGQMQIGLVSVAPAGAVSADFIAFPTKYEAGGQLVGNFDQLFLEKNGGSSLIVTP